MSKNVTKTGIADRACRWLLEGVGFFPSKRAAIYYEKYGKTFKTKPVYEVINGRRSQKRVR